MNPEENKKNDINAIDVHKLVNWSELSRAVTKGDRNSIRPTKCPKKHKEKIHELFSFLEKWASDL